MCQPCSSPPVPWDGFALASAVALPGELGGAVMSLCVLGGGGIVPTDLLELLLGLQHLGALGLAMLSSSLCWLLDLFLTGRQRGTD